MNYTEALTRYTANFIDELVARGVRDVVVSPGSRSTPLAVLVAEHEEIEDWVVIDERSAGYFALGIAQATDRPVALVCTSGTAVANYFPAVVEAYYARVPLLVLTADRPHELRDIGASQTIDQIKMFGHFVKGSFEMAPPKADEASLAYVRNRASRAVKRSLLDNPGPVHVNFPFDEPLMPDITLPNLWQRQKGQEKTEWFVGKKQLDELMLDELLERIESKEKGLIVCGPQRDKALVDELIQLSDKLRIPILADPLSQLRTTPYVKNTVMGSYDAYLRSEKVRQGMKPDYILRFGAMPISKHLSFYLKEHADVPQYIIENYDHVREPLNVSSNYIVADGAGLCKALNQRVSPNRKQTTAWFEKWLKMENEARNVLSQGMVQGQLTEGRVSQIVLDSLEDGSHFFVANSMPVRDVDTFLIPTSKDIRLYANRGVSGIDGTLSSAIGVAATGKKVTLLIGDLSFYHDLNSLFIAKRYELPITIILINNNGGGIFSFLPQAKEEKHFEHLFGTPLNIDFAHAVEMYEGDYFLVEKEEELKEVLLKDKKRKGFSVIEVQTDRVENVTWHRALWDEIITRVEKK